MCKRHVHFNNAVFGLVVFLIVISVSVVNAAALQQEKVTPFHSKVNKLAANDSKGEELIRLKVNGMTCSACEGAVRRALLNVEGVKSAEVSYKKEMAVVKIEEGTAKVNELIKAVEKAGFSASEN